jgi:hypothetical protein
VCGACLQQRVVRVSLCRQAKLTQPCPPCAVSLGRKKPCQPCPALCLVIRQNRGDGVKLSLVPAVIRRSTEETTPNPHCDVHFGDEKSQKISQETHRLLLARLVHFLFVGFCFTAPVTQLGFQLGGVLSLLTAVELHAKLIRGIQEGVVSSGIYRPLIDIT